MQRVWATGGEHDRGPMEWIGAIREETVVADYLRAALETATAAGATIEQCQTGMLAIECVTYIQGGDADAHPMLIQWMHERRPNADEKLRAKALDALAKLRADSTLATHWGSDAAWSESLDKLRDRLTNAKRKPDPSKDKRIAAFGKHLDDAKKYLRLALTPYAIVDEPIVHILVAPNLSAVAHYADVDDLEPVPVPIEHARNWKKTERAVAKLAAQQTREALDLRTHIVEHEGFEINVAFGSNAFTAGLLPFIDILAGNDTPYGVLVAAPNAGTLVYHRIVDARWNEAAVAVIKQVREIFETTAQQISPQLWWWNAGKVIELPYAVVAENYIIEPIEAFMTVVRPLG